MASKLVVCNYWIHLGLKCDGCIFDQITRLLVSMGKGSKDDHPMELWNLIIFSLGEVESF